MVRPSTTAASVPSIRWRRARDDRQCCRRTAAVRVCSRPSPHLIESDRRSCARRISLGLMNAVPVTSQAPIKRAARFHSEAINCAIVHYAAHRMHGLAIAGRSIAAERNLFFHPARKHLRGRTQQPLVEEERMFRYFPYRQFMRHRMSIGSNRGRHWPTETIAQIRAETGRIPVSMPTDGRGYHHSPRISAGGDHPVTQLIFTEKVVEQGV